MHKPQKKKKKKKIIIYSKQLKDLKINYGKVRP